MPVYQLVKEMPYTELLQWIEFFNSRPIGYREDYRTFLLLKAAGFDGKAEDLFMSIKAISDKVKKQEKEDRAVPKGLFLAKMLEAKNGDNSGWKPK
jgi:hypothetical protein